MQNGICPEWTVSSEPAGYLEKQDKLNQVSWEWENVLVKAKSHIQALNQDHVFSRKV